MASKKGGNTSGKASGPAEPAGKKAEEANPPAKAESPAEISAIDALQLALDLAGMIPGAGAVPDLINAVISLVRGDLVGALFSAGAAVPAIGDAAGAAKIIKNSDKYLQALKTIERKVLPMLPQGMRKKLEDYLKQVRDKIDEVLKKDKPEAKPEPVKAKDNDGAKSQGKRSVDKGKCGEWLAKMDMSEQGFDEIVSVQNKSGHGVDLIGRNSTTGEVKVWEVKTTETNTAPSLSKEQGRLGGERFTDDRLKRATNGVGNYGKVPEAMKNADLVTDWLSKANQRNAPVSYEKREVFVDDLAEGCKQHPGRPSRSKPWNAKQ